VSAGQFLLQPEVVAQVWPAGSGASGNGNMGLISFSVTTGFLS
jgi:hypothetical protein